MSTIADYAGRTVDIMALQGVSAAVEVLLEQSLADSDGGTLCTGVQKLAQRWLLEFFTETGSMQYLPLRGCDFMVLLKQGVLRTTLDAQQAFFAAAQQVQLNLQMEETAAMPDDERFASVDLLGITRTGDTLKVSIRLTSIAGTTAKLIMPIAATTF